MYFSQPGTCGGGHEPRSGPSPRRHRASQRQPADGRDLRPRRRQRQGSSRRLRRRRGPALRARPGRAETTISVAGVARRHHGRRRRRRLGHAVRRPAASPASRPARTAGAPRRSRAVGGTLTEAFGIVAASRRARVCDGQGQRQHRARRRDGDVQVLRHGRPAVADRQRPRRRPLLHGSSELHARPAPDQQRPADHGRRRRGDGHHAAPTSPRDRRPRQPHDGHVRVRPDDRVRRGGHRPGQRRGAVPGRAPRSPALAPGTT